MKSLSALNVNKISKNSGENYLSERSKEIIGNQYVNAVNSLAFDSTVNKNN